MVILVCGGRDYNDRNFLFDYLNQVNKRTPIIGLIHGNARGADRLAKEWQDIRIAVERSVSKRGHLWCAGYRALWEISSRAAGPIRNAYMASLGVDLGVAFPGSRGTANMVSLLQQRNIPVILAGGGEVGPQ